ncbi:MAG: hypothetical protein ABIZ04_02880 [Opitutus sp.]
MNTIQKIFGSKNRPSITGCAVGSAATLLLFGCQTEPTGGAPGGQQASLAAFQGKTGAQLWSESCNRCHNYRSPSSYSDNQWKIATHHMRVRANLTAEEEKKILAFLTSAN